MPAAIPLLIAGASMAAEGATIAGTLAAVGGGSALLGGVVLAGSALSTLGTITGSQKLQRIGGIVGLVGGVGAIANGLAGASGTLSQVAEQSAKEGATAFEHGAGAADALGQTAATAPVVGGAPAVSDAAAQAENAGQIGIDNAASGGVLGKGASPGVIGGNAAPGSPVKALLPGSAPLDPNAYAPNIVNSPASSGVGGTLGKVGSFVKDNKELANVAGGIVTGGLSDYNKQKMQQRAYDMQQQAILADRARQTASVTGLQMPGYVPPPVPVPPKG